MRLRSRGAAWVVVVVAMAVAASLPPTAAAAEEVEGTFETVSPVDGRSFGGPSGSTSIRLTIDPARKGSIVFTPEAGDPITKPVEWRFDRTKKKLAVKIAGTKRVAGSFVEEGGTITFGGATWIRAGATPPAAPAPVPDAPEAPAPVPAAPVPAAPADPLLGLWASRVSDGSAIVVALSPDGTAELAVVGRHLETAAVARGTWSRSAATLRLDVAGRTLHGGYAVDGTGLRWLGVPWRKQR